jgi:hypothetical protein
LFSVFSVACRLIGEVDDARGEVLRLRELQRRPLLALLEEALAAPDEHGVDEELELVEQTFPERDRARAPLPETTMSLPGCCLRSEMPSANSSPLISVEFCHARGSSRVAETTYLARAFICAANGFCSGSCFDQSGAHSS